MVELAYELLEWRLAKMRNRLIVLATALCFVQLEVNAREISAENVNTIY